MRLKSVGLPSKNCAFYWEKAEPRKESSKVIYKKVNWK